MCQSPIFGCSSTSKWKARDSSSLFHASMILCPLSLPPLPSDSSETCRRRRECLKNCSSSAHCTLKVLSALSPNLHSCDIFIPHFHKVYLLIYVLFTSILTQHPRQSTLHRQTRPRYLLHPLPSLRLRFRCCPSQDWLLLPATCVRYPLFLLAMLHGTRYIAMRQASWP